MEKYNHKEIEKKWQKIWDENKVSKIDKDDTKNKYYILDMFPYPSGEGLHMGHTESYTASDVFYRFKKMQGFNVLHPQGFDAFGLPAENYAIKTGVHPVETTKKNMENYLRQWKSLGLGHDFENLIITSDPKYYKWTQWIFEQFYKNNWVYQSTQKANWCSSCQTVIANEQVVGGECERCGTKIEQKEIPGWFFKITDFADELIDGLDKIDWPEYTKKNQKNWIGKSNGAKIKFKLSESFSKEPVKKEDVIILHGWCSSSESDFIPEIKKFLENLGHRVFAFNQPNTNKPKFDEWFDFIEDKIKGNNLKNFSIIGHSMGGYLALKLAEKYKLEKLVLVSPVGFCPPEKYFEQFSQKLTEKNLNTFKAFQNGRTLDPALVKENSKEIEFIFGENDKWVTKEIRDSYVNDFLDTAKIQVLSGKGHLSESEGVRRIKELENIFDQDKNHFIEVFTTRPDTLFGATYMVLAPEHKLVSELKDQITNWDEVEKYIEQSKNKTEMERIENKEKTGVELKGIKAINPANQEEIPIFIADYVLAGYGTGAIMAVPAHDERDFEFARKYNIDIKEVVYPKIVKYTVIEKSLKNCEENLKKFGDIKIVSNDKDWGNFYEVSLLKEKEDEFLDYLKNNLLHEEISGASSFYTDSCGTSNYVVFKDNIFRVLNKKEFDNYKNYGGKIGIPEEQLDIKVNVFKENGVLVNSGEFTGINSGEAKQKITEFVGGEMTTNYRLRDWSISRQRYWGCPIPVVYSPEGEAKLVPEEHLPWILPTDVDFKPTGVSPLSESKELKERVEKIFGKGWTPEYDTMDTFVDSAWYFLRYPDVYNEKEFCSEARKKWLPVDLYIGGAEHTYMHLLFARFFTKAMYKIGLLDFDEPFIKLKHQGMVLDAKGKKMSKSKGNVVNPDEMVERFGADSVRTYMLFAAPLEDEVIWNEDNIVGIYRFLEKVWRIKETVNSKVEDKNLEAQNKVKNLLHKTIKKVEEDIENLRYNTAISSMMILVNYIEKKRDVNKSDYEMLLKILSPFAPHITQELWNQLENKNLIQNEKWPKFDKNLAKDLVHKVIIQINGKVRDEVEIEDNFSQEVVEKIALDRSKIIKWLGESKPKRIIYIKNRLLNIVI